MRHVFAARAKLLTLSRSQAFSMSTSTKPKRPPAVAREAAWQALLLPD